MGFLTSALDGLQAIPVGIHGQKTRKTFLVSRKLSQGTDGGVAITPKHARTVALRP